MGSPVHKPHSDFEAAVCADLRPRLLLYGLRHTRSHLEAEDLAQDVLVRVVEAIREERFDHREEIGPYALGTARYMLWDRRRKASRRSREEETWTLGPTEFASQPDPVLNRQKLLDCIDLLTNRTARVLEMSLLLGHPSPEIAQELGLSAVNVRVIRSRGLKQLKACIDGS